MRIVILFGLLVSLAGCVTMAPPSPRPAPPPGQDAQMAVANFVEVVDRVEPVAEQVCRQQAQGLNCDFQILVDRDPRAGVNAFYTVSQTGQPLIIYTLGLIAGARNTDELAFVLGHEAGHHIAQHLPQQQRRAAVGAQVFADWARQQGGNAAAIGEAAQVGSIVAARQFGQRAELEADAIGTAIAYAAGYDPVRGSAFFGRLPDPDAAFLSSHPPNQQRLDTVRRTLDALQAGGDPFGS